ncbi:protein of unknown function [Nitratireductor aquimarinus]
MPVSRDSSAASSSPFFSTRWKRRVRQRPRSTAGMRLHGPSSNALRADCTASSTSASLEAGIEAKTAPSDGLRTSMRSPESESTERPSMNCMKARPSATLREKWVPIPAAPVCNVCMRAYAREGNMGKPAMPCCVKAQMGAPAWLSPTDALPRNRIWLF